MTSLLTKEDVEKFISDTLINSYDKSKLTGNALRKIISLEVPWHRVANSIPHFYINGNKRYNLKLVCKWLEKNSFNYIKRGN